LGSGFETGALSTFRHSFFSLKILPFLICLTSHIGGISLAESNSPQTYIATLLPQANQQQLYNHRYWHLLLHYRNNVFGGVTSEVDDQNSFLSLNGKTDPQAELEATIRAFFQRTSRENLNKQLSAHSSHDITGSKSSSIGILLFSPNSPATNLTRSFPN